MSARSCLIPLIAGLITFVCAFCFLLALAGATGFLPPNLSFSLPTFFRPPSVVIPAPGPGGGPTDVPGRGTIQRSSRLEVTLLGVRRVESKSNTIAVATTVQIRNISDQPVDVAPLLMQFRLIDQNGAEYAADLFNPAPNSLQFPIQNLAQGTLKPLPSGQTVEGDVFFTLARNVPLVALQWWPSPFEPRFRFRLATDESNGPLTVR